MILCEDLRGQREALRVAERARAAIAEPFLVRGHELAATDPNATRMLGAVLGVARAAELTAIAEGIETVDQLEAARDLGCDGGLGFLFAAPAPADELGARLASRKG